MARLERERRGYPNLEIKPLNTYPGNMVRIEAVTRGAPETLEPRVAHEHGCRSDVRLALNDGDIDRAHAKGA